MVRTECVSGTECEVFSGTQVETKFPQGHERVLRLRSVVLKSRIRLSLVNYAGSCVHKVHFSYYVVGEVNTCQLILRVGGFLYVIF